MFSSFLSLFLSLFFCLFLRISYAGPFEPRLIGVDGTALQRYNGKPNIFVRKFDVFFFFVTSEAFGALSLPVRELVLIILSTRILPY